MTEHTIYMLAFMFRNGRRHVCNRYGWAQREYAVAAMRRENRRENNYAGCWRWYLHKATVATL